MAIDVRLVVEQGRRLREVRLRGPATRIGRARGSGIRIPSAEVSRQHCVLRTEDDLVTVEDLDSVNGTYVNGAPIAGRQVLRPGDRLTVGPVTFLVQYELTPEALERLRAEQDYDYEILDPGEGGLEVVEDGAAPLAVSDELVLEEADAVWALDENEVEAWDDEDQTRRPEKR